MTDAPICEECDLEMTRYRDPNTRAMGWGCDRCGWSEDDVEQAPAKTTKAVAKTPGQELYEAMQAEPAFFYVSDLIPWDRCANKEAFARVEARIAGTVRQKIAENGAKIMEKVS